MNVYIIVCKKKIKTDIIVWFFFLMGFHFSIINLQEIDYIILSNNQLL